MNTTIGLLIIGMGAIGHASSYMPVKKVHTWAWESFWLVQGLFAWLLFPYIGTLIAMPAGTSLLELYTKNSSIIANSILLGAGWGFGGLVFGLSLRYLGVALGQSIALGTCSAFGTLLPAAMMGEGLFTGKGLILLISVSIGIAGISVIGYAISLKSKNMTAEEKKKAVEDFSFKQGVFIAILAGLMSACFGLGLVESEPIRISAIQMGANPILAGLPSILLVSIGGFIVNALFSISQNISHNTGSDYFKVSFGMFIKNVFFCALAGGLWYLQFVGLTAGKSFFADGSIMHAFSWSVLMVFNVAFSTLLGIMLKEWKGLSVKAIIVLGVGIILLIFSTIFPSIN